MTLIRPLRVVHLNSEAGFRGGEQQVLYLMRYLRDLGVENTLASLPDQPLAAKARELRFPVEAFPYPREFSVGGCHRLHTILRDHDADVLHAHSARAASMAGAMRALAPGVKIVVARRVDFSLRGNPLRRLKYETLPHRTVAISEAIRQVLIADGIRPEAVTTIPSGIDVARFDQAPCGTLRAELGLPPETVLVGSVGALTHHKGFDLLIQVVRRIGKTGLPAHFIWIGTGDQEYKLRDMALNMSNLSIMGFREDVVNALKSFDLFTLLSRSEGLGTSLLDAMACRLPVVSTRTGGIPEAVVDGETGLLHAPEDLDGHTEALRRLIVDAGERQRFGEAGRRRVEERFQASATAARTLELYRELGAG